MFKTFVINPLYYILKTETASTSAGPSGIMGEVVMILLDCSQHLILQIIFGCLKLCPKKKYSLCRFVLETLYGNTQF